MHTLPQNRYKSVLWHIASVFKVKNGRLSDLTTQKTLDPMLQIYMLCQFTSIYIKLQYPPIMNHCQKGGGNPPQKKGSSLIMPRCLHKYPNSKSQGPPIAFGCCSGGYRLGPLNKRGVHLKDDFVLPQNC